MNAVFGRVQARTAMVGRTCESNQQFAESKERSIRCFFFQLLFAVQINPCLYSSEKNNYFDVREIDKWKFVFRSEI
jgi:hypothetical protein